MDTRPGGANPTTTDNPPPPRRSLAEARAAKKAAFSSKANKVRIEQTTSKHLL